MLADLAQDLRLALRLLRKNPGFTLVAVLSLALGIGANTAIFTVVNAAMLKTLPVRAPEELRLVGRASPPATGTRLNIINSGFGANFPYPALEAFQARTDTFAAVIGFARLSIFASTVNAIVDGQPAVVEADGVTGGYFSGLGVAPLLGRAIVADDLRPGAPLVAVLNHGYWSRRFGRDPSVLGKRISFNGVPATVVGVAPAGFFGVEPGRNPDVWLPLTDRAELAPWGASTMTREHPVFTSRTWWWLGIVVRLKPGVSDEQARQVLTTTLHDSIRGHLPSATEANLPQATVAPGARGLNIIRRRFSTTFTILMATVGLVLLAACANVATLLLARATARRKEISVRLALGASRLRLLRQLFTESLVLALLGGVCGLWLAYGGSRALIAVLSTSRSPLAIDVQLQPDPIVLLFATGASVLAGLLFGLAPALRATRVRLAPVLSERGGGGGGEMMMGGTGAAARWRIGFGSPLIVAQVAVSLLLLIGAGLFVRSLQNLEGQDLGFDREHLLLFGLDLAHRGEDDMRASAVYREVVERLEAQPGVRSATLVQQVLLAGVTNSTTVVIEGVNTNQEQTQSEGQRPGQTPLPPQGRDASVLWNHVGPRFFETMQIPRLLGREIDWRDTEDAPPVAVINETMARRFFGTEPAIGRRFRLNWPPGSPAIEVVGVVKDAKYDTLRNAPAPTAYLPAMQRSGRARLHVVVRTAGDPIAMVPLIRRAVQEVAPDLPLVHVRTQTEQVSESVVAERLFAQLFSAFGVLALLLACIGLHGTIAYAVGRRTREIGIRMALGAQRGQVLHLILRDALLLVTAGILVGVPMAIAASRLVTSQLYEVKGSDPLTLGIASVVMMATTLLAAFLPARRATRIDPMAALRND